MIGSVNTERASRSLEFGMYRDGDNNLDEVQAQTIAQAAETSATDSRIEFTVEDTTARRGLEPAHVLRTESYTIADGDVTGNIKVSPPHDMSARKDLATFVDHVLDNAEKSGAKATWLDLIDHGGGDGGGLQSEHSAVGIMREDDIAGAIADGVAQHAKEHPEDADRKIDGVVANQCLMATVAFSSALSNAGVKYLAASPGTQKTLHPNREESMLNKAAGDEPPMAITPRDFTYDASAFANLSLSRPIFPDALELPMLWMSVHSPGVVFTTTIAKLLHVTVTEGEKALHHGNRDSPPEDLRIEPWLWIRTVVHVMHRLGSDLYPQDLDVLLSQFWTTKVFVDSDGNDWTADSFQDAVREFLPD